MNNDNQWTGPAAAAGTLTMDELLHHESFVHSVVRRLVSDEAEVQDVVQSTWVKALEHPPKAHPQFGQRSTMAWLARVATNLVRSKQRSEGRRSHREGAVAKREHDDSWVESVDRLESRQRMVEVVLGLKEPYRSVVVLRYEKGLSVEQIASSSGCSAGTVRSQLSRAHDMLRKRLDRDFGDRDSWAVLALPIGGGGWAPGSGSASIDAQSGTWTGGPKAGAHGVGKATTGFKVAMFSVGLVGACLVLGGLWHLSKRADAGEHAQISGVLPEGGGAALTELAVIDRAMQKRDAADGIPLSVENSPGLWSGPPPETLLPQAHLLSHSTHTYEAATFSFEYGMRDDPGEIVRNDWEVYFCDKTLEACNSTYDRSVIVDLGNVRLADVHPGLLDGASLGEEAEAKVGNSYLVWTRDSETDLVSAFEVVEMEFNDHCVLDWYTVNHRGQASGSFHEDGSGPFLVNTMQALRDDFQTSNVLALPRMFLQARAGYQGGSSCLINGLGELNGRFDGLSEQALDLSGGIGKSKPSLGYAEGGAVPPGMIFDVKRVIYSGFQEEEGRNRGEFEIRIGRQSIVPRDYALDRNVMVWTGSIPVRAGSEKNITLMASHFTQGEALIEGEFIQEEREQPVGELVANGMYLFPPVELPEGYGVNFDRGEVFKVTGRGPRFDLGLFGKRAGYGTAQMYPLGDCFLDQLDVNQLPEEAKESPIPLHVGHSYLLIQPFFQTTVFRVEALDPGTSCTLDWYTVNHNGQVIGSHLDGPGNPLQKSIDELRLAARKRLELAKPFVHLQMQVINRGGNWRRVPMASALFHPEESPEPLVLSGVPLQRDDKACYREGGLVPEGMVFVVSRVEYRVISGPSDKKGKRPIAIRVGQTYVVQEEDFESNINNVWTGRIEIRPDEESSVYIEGTYDLAMEARISGRFIPDNR